MTQWVQCLPSAHEALGSTVSTAKGGCGSLHL